MAAGNVLTAASVNQQIAADAYDQVGKYFQWRRWYDYYSQNFASAAQLTAAGVSNGTDQILFQNLTGDLNKLITRFAGGTPAAQTNYLYDAEIVQAWRHDPILLKQELANAVANPLLDMYYWWLRHYQIWSTNATNAILTAAPLSFASADATAIQNVYNDMNTLALEFNNGAPGAALNLWARCTVVLGVQG